uniref:Uncharacterized protein n=1 Tax=Lactuca sativa TaxID=4236 RepID=A0A9R1W4U0_LACSA|nr:hypothetical protein LSAT_V11C300118450 [Lactuca sativa]
MTTSTSRSSFNGGLRRRNKKVKGGNCGFFKWLDEELGREMKMSHTEQIKPLLEVIIGLLVVILLMLAIVGTRRVGAKTRRVGSQTWSRVRDWTRRVQIWTRRVDAVQQKP